MATAALAAFTISAHAQQVPAQPPPTGPVYVVTHVDIIGGQAGVNKAIKLMHDFQVDSLKDGALRFEVMEQDNRLNHFAMVEVWPSREAYEAHQSHEHTRKFRDEVGPMLGSPFDVRLHRLML